MSPDPPDRGGICNSPKTEQIIARNLSIGMALSFRLSSGGSVEESVADSATAVLTFADVVVSSAADNLDSQSSGVISHGSVTSGDFVSGRFHSAASFSDASRPIRFCVRLPDDPFRCLLVK